MEDNYEKKTIKFTLLGNPQNPSVFQTETDMYQKHFALLIKAKIYNENGGGKVLNLDVVQRQELSTCRRETFRGVG